MTESTARDESRVAHRRVREERSDHIAAKELRLHADTENRWQLSLKVREQICATSPICVVPPAGALLGATDTSLHVYEDEASALREHRKHRTCSPDTGRAEVHRHDRNAERCRRRFTGNDEHRAVGDADNLRAPARRRRAGQSTRASPFRSRSRGHRIAAPHPRHRWRSARLRSPQAAARRVRRME